MTDSEFTERLERTQQRLQRFREHHEAQLSHTDRRWLHLACMRYSCTAPSSLTPFAGGEQRRGRRGSRRNGRPLGGPSGPRSRG